MSNDVSQAKNSSTPAFITALVFNGAIFAIELFVFTILRRKFKAVYEPRTYVPPKGKRADSLTSSLFGWPLAIYRADHREIIPANGVDAYLFVRFLRFCIKIFLPIWLLSWAVLMPVDSVKSSVPGLTGLDKFTFGNVAPNKQARYAAHLIMAYIFTGWILFNIRGEMAHFVTTRQEYLISEDYASSTQASTVLITGIPNDYLTERKLTEMYNHLPGGVKKVWLNRDLKELPDLYDRRLKACNKLESAESKLLRTAAKLHLKSKKNAPDPESGSGAIIPNGKRPSHRTGFLSLFGKKVDSIDWARDEISLCNKGLNSGREVIDRQTQAGLGLVDQDSSEHAPLTGHPEVKKPKHPVEGDHSYPPVNSAFITFNEQLSAHLAMNALAHHEPYQMADRFIDVAPGDIIWTNLGLNPYAMKIRKLISYTLTAGLIIFWSIPVAFVGIVSNVPQLCVKYKWLSWLCKIPKPVVGIISGILPAVLLAVLFILLPIVLRKFIKAEGVPKNTMLELGLMNRFFLFIVIHGFLIVSISSGLIKALPELSKNPSQTPTLLAKNLPSASTFFLTFILLQGLSGTAGGFLQIGALVGYYAKLYILGSTPRSIYNIMYGPQTVQWGTLFPNTTLLVVIAFGYMIIAPIINGLAFVSFTLFYFMYKFQFLWQYTIPRSSETGGLFFPKAINHTFVGLYIQQICLAALFFLAQDDRKHQSAIREGVLMIVLIVLTALFHLVIRNSYGPLIHPLPLSLADRTYITPEQHRGPQTDAQATDYIKTAREHDTNVDPNNDGEIRSLAAEENTELGGFAHPAVSLPQRTVWIPRDHLGLCDEEVAGCSGKGVRSSTAGASMNEKGKVNITAAPPYDE